MASKLPSAARGLICALPLVFGAVLHAEADPLDTLQKETNNWVKLRTEAARLDTDWHSEKQLLESTIVALQSRASKLEDKRDAERAATAKDRSELQSLKDKNVEVDAALRKTEARLRDIDAQLVALRPLLPPRLSSALDLAYRSLADKDLALGERARLTMTVLTRYAQFNQTVTYGEETVALGGSAQPRVLEVIYWGGGFAYAVDRGTREAWYGSPRDKAWQWEAKPEAFADVCRLIAIQQGRTDPEFVNLPVRLAHTAN